MQKHLYNKKILLAVTGSIAAYKSAVLVRLLVKVGASVRVIMTDGAKDFITPLTLATLSKNEVYAHFYEAETGHWHNHVELALWADVFLVAPASANELAKMAHGLCDNLLTAVYLSAKCPVIVAPAMDLDMYVHPATRANLSTLAQYGHHIIEAETGELASGLNGQGRMAEPEHIVAYLEDFFAPETALFGKKVLLTAGPTREAIDPVRFVSNHSTGKMGMALALTLAQKGANVFLVAGPMGVANHANVHVTKVHTAAEMLEACKSHFSEIDVAIFTAAVADYRPKNVASEKIKKQADSLTIELIKNDDIALEFGKIKRAHQLSVGFALETENGDVHALQKLKNKNFDMVVLNSTNNEGAGFGHDTNKVTIFHQNGEKIVHSLKHKTEVAQDIVYEIEKIIRGKRE